MIPIAQEKKLSGLLDLDTPFGKKKMVVRGKGGRKEVSVKLVQHIDGTLYKSPNRTNLFGEPIFDVYSFFPEYNIGCLLYPSVGGSYPNLEMLHEYCQREGVDSPEHFLSLLELRMEQGKPLYEENVLLATHLDAERAAALAEYHQRMVSGQERRSLESKANRAREITELCQENNRLAEEMYQKAVEVICRGGRLENETITVYEMVGDSNYKSRSYALINYLANRHHVEIPLQTKGWIAANLERIFVNPSGSMSTYHSHNYNSTLFESCMKRLFGAIQSTQAQDMKDAEQQSEEPASSQTM